MNPVASDPQAVRGFFGMMATGTGLAVSFLPWIETMLRLTSLTLGVAIGVVTLVTMLKKKPAK